MKLKKGLQIFGIWCLSLMILLTGCEMKQVGNMAKTEVEFTVVEPDEVPSELAVIIEENKQGEIKLTYEDQGYMYLVRGYGQQKTGGYSIAVKELYLTDNSIVIDTELLGPEKGENPAPETSYPYIVVKTENLENPVIFQ